jgi:WD40 repeat protein
MSTNLRKYRRSDLCPSAWRSLGSPTRLSVRLPFVRRIPQRANRRGTTRRPFHCSARYNGQSTRICLTCCSKTNAIAIRGAHESIGQESSRGCCLIASTLLALIPAIGFSQGRPPIIWASGGRSESVNSVAYSPDGQLLVSGSSDRTIKVWSYDGTFIKSLAIPYDPNAQLTDVRSAAVSPDGTLIAAGVEEYTNQTEFGAVQIWRISDGQLVQNFTGYSQVVNSVAFSPDGQYLASGSKDRSVKVWRMANAHWLAVVSTMRSR